jgi:hypothetical protein
VKTNPATNKETPTVTDPNTTPPVGKPGGAGKAGGVGQTALSRYRRIAPRTAPEAAYAYVCLEV